MKRKIFTTALLSCCFIIAMAAAFADLNGKWTGVLKTPDGNALDVAYTFKVDGEKITGMATSQMGDITLENGKIKGDDFSFSVNVQGNDYPHSGKVYADSCGVNIDFGGGNLSHFTLKRSK